MPGLISLHLVGCRDASDRGVAALLRGCARLRALHLGWRGVTNRVRAMVRVRVRVRLTRAPSLTLTLTLTPTLTLPLTLPRCGVSNRGVGMIATALHGSLTAL